MITETAVTEGPLYVSQGLLAQIRYALEEGHIGDYEHMPLSGLYWVVRDHREKNEKLYKNGGSLT